MDEQEAKERLEAIALSTLELGAGLDVNYHTLVSLGRGTDGIRPSKPGKKFSVWDATKVQLYFRHTACGFPSRDAKYIVNHFLEINPKPSLEEQSAGTFVSVFVDRQHCPTIHFFKPGNTAVPELVAALMQKGYTTCAWSMGALYKEVAERLLAWLDRKEYRPVRSQRAQEMIAAFQAAKEKLADEVKN